MSHQGAVPERVVGRRAAMSKRGRVLLGIFIVAYFGWGIALLVNRRSNGYLFTTLAILYAVVYVRPSTVVDRVGIIRPWRRPKSLTWDDVEHVVAPQLGAGSVKVRLTTGKTLSLIDVPADRSADVAAIGGVPVVAPPRPLAPPSRPARRTDRDIEVDVERRARALSERGRQLDAEYRRIRGSRPGAE